MKTTFYLAVILTCLLTACDEPPQTAEESTITTFDFNDGWQFALDDGAWRDVTLPHDWSVEFPFDSIKGEGATGYLLGGMGKYRKTFASPGTAATYVLFDGVYNNATVSLNGHKLGTHPFGYAPYYYELTEHLNPAGEANEMLVEVDRSRYADSRWYTGSGIYRDVELHAVPATHIPVWGTFVTTPEATETGATVRVQTTIKHIGAGTPDARLVSEILGPDGRTIATETSPLHPAAAPNEEVVQTINVAAPELWDVDSPTLYTVVSRVETEEGTTQEYRTPFGIRSFRFDPAEGFFLNGKNRKIKGVCLHHAAGLVGAAVPKAVWRRRLQTLKDGGCNAIRSAHNPASQEFLDLCDEMGFLVQDEFYDEWDYPKDKRKNMGESTSTDYITRGHHEHFQEWAETDLKNTVLSHRNHPSIIQWSIGNEIEWTYPRQKETTGFFGADANGNYFWNEPPYGTAKIKELQQSLPRTEYQIGETAQKLADWTRDVDTTRPVIANCILPSASYESGYADALDIIGFSYRRIMYDYAHKNYPDLPVMGTENLAQWHEWKAIEERPWISGTFLWTGVDYLGESNGGWPKTHTTSGLLNMAGFPKPSYYMMRSLWSDETTAALYTQTAEKSIFRVNDDGEVVEKKPGAWERALWTWHDVNSHWNYEPGETVIVEAISNLPELELTLNGESLGTKRLADFPDRIYKWAVPFAAGELKLNVKPQAGAGLHRLATASAPASLEATTLSGEGGITHVEFDLVDGDKNPVRYDDRRLSFSFDGPGELLGVDNGMPDNTSAFQGGKVKTGKGKALAIVRGEGTLTVSGEGLVEMVVRVGD